MRSLLPLISYLLFTFIAVMLLSMTVNIEARCCFNSILISVLVALISLKICWCVIQQLLILRLPLM